MSAPLLRKSCPVLSLEIFVFSVHNIPAYRNAVGCHKFLLKPLCFCNEYCIALGKTVIALPLHTPVTYQLAPPAYDLTLFRRKACDVTLYLCYDCRFLGSGLYPAFHNRRHTFRCGRYRNVQPTVILLFQLFGQCSHGDHILITIVAAFDNRFKLSVCNAFLYVSYRTALYFSDLSDCQIVHITPPSLYCL